ncbi:MAG: hypothetical protein ACYS0G_10035 [Planctomycetota bacterium]|jgi:type II secretory pathway pseudopilin PulG
MNRRGLTLLELLLAIGLLVALGALVWPAFVGSLNERAFETTADVVRHQLLLARAHAQTTGVPVEVTYRRNPPRIEARLFQAGPIAVEQGTYVEPLDATDDDRGEPPGIDDEQSDREGLIASGWAHRRLPDEIWIATRRGDDPDENGEGEADAGQEAEWGGGAPDTTQEEDLDERPWIRLAVFVPDGSALLGAPVWLRDSDGRLGRLQVNAWTGLPSFDRVTETADEPPPPAEEEREEPEALAVEDRAGPPVAAEAPRETRNETEEAGAP